MGFQTIAPINGSCTFHPTKKFKHYPKLTIQNKEVTFVKVAKFLGISFDEHLTWAHHIDELVKRCNQDLNLLRSLKGTQWGTNQETILTLYGALTRSKLDYGCQVYATAPKRHINKLNKIQRKALLIGTGALPSTSTAELQVLTGELQLHLRRLEHILKYISRLSTHDKT